MTGTNLSSRYVCVYSGECYVPVFMTLSAKLWQVYINITINVTDTILYSMQNKFPGKKYRQYIIVCRYDTYQQVEG